MRYTWVSPKVECCKTHISSALFKYDDCQDADPRVVRLFDPRIEQIDYIVLSSKEVEVQEIKVMLAKHA